MPKDKKTHSLFKRIIKLCRMVIVSLIAFNVNGFVCGAVCESRILTFVIACYIIIEEFLKLKFVELFNTRTL